jgi:hypothetical protein
MTTVSGTTAARSVPETRNRPTDSEAPDFDASARIGDLTAPYDLGQVTAPHSDTFSVFAHG